MRDEDLTAEERLAIQQVSRAFCAGMPLRRLLDDASAVHGTAAWSRESAQRALLASTISYIPDHAPSAFTFGARRKARFARALLDEVDHIKGATLDETLLNAAAAACADKKTDFDENESIHIVLDMPKSHTIGEVAGSVEVVLSVSSAFSDVGHRVWEAGIFLHTLAVNKKSRLSADIAGRRILELGSGTGLSAVAFFEARAARVVLSDHKQDVVDNIQSNVEWNIPKVCETLVATEKLDLSDLMLLKRTLERHQIQTVIAADVTYDPFLRQAVVKAFQSAVLSSPRVGYLLATRRNTHSEESLITELKRSGMHVEALEEEYDTSHFDYLCDYDLSRVQVFRLTSKSD